MTRVKYLRVHWLKTFNAKLLTRDIGSALREATPMDGACAALVEAGLIRVRSEQAGSTPGRPAKNYDVNPVVLGGVA